MRILVTGGSGFIGSHIVDKLVEAGHKIRILDIKPPYRKDVEFIQGDIVSKTDVRRSLEDIDAVYHIAAFSNIDFVKDSPLETIEFNILGTAYLLDECRRRNIKRFILASSVYVHDKRGHLYTTSKLTSELLCKNYYTLYSLPYTILRYGTVYGPRSRNVDVISIFVRKALNSETLVIRGSGNQKRNFIYVEDAAYGSVLALNEKAKNEIFVLAGFETTTVRELAQLVNRLFGNKLIIEFEPANQRIDDYQGEIRNSTKIKEELGWEPKFSLEEGTRQYIQWYKRDYAK